MFCPMCGAANEEDSIFCGNCGAVLNPDAAPAQEAGSTLAEAAPSLPAVEERPAQPIPAVPRLPTSGMAVASLVLSITGMTALPLLGSILALILGYMARSDIRRRPHEVSGEEIATVSIILSWITIGLAVLGLMAFGTLMVCGLCGAAGSSYR